MPPQICQSLFLRGLSLVGWYHSHPFGPALPSLHDIDAQMDYQLKLQGSGNGFQPCLGLICGTCPMPGVPGGLGLLSPPCASPLCPHRALLPRQPRRGVQNRALLGDAAAGGKRGRIWGGVPPGWCQSCGVTPAWLPHPPATAQ